MNTEIIEKYLLNLMTAEEKAAFEKELAANPELQKELEVQQKLMQAIDRTAMKTGLQHAMKRFVLKKKLKHWGIGIAITAAIVVISYAAYKNTKTGETTLRYETNELGTTEFADADKYLPSQIFNIDNNEDTIIETKDGIVFGIPAHAFKNADGSVANGRVDIEIKEALNTADIIKAGLSTKSNDELLETGGMFYFNARSGKTNLNLAKEINVSVPTDEIKPDMKLFEGKRTADGGINWVNPVELDKELITYNITDLDFYPPNYIPTLQKLGLDYKNKKFTDSLYYSFTGYGAPSQNQQPMNYPQQPPSDGVELPNPKSKLFKFVSTQQAVESPYINDFADSLRYVYNYEIDPSLIRTIWNEKYNNTILATREFEERLKYIQSRCGACESSNMDVFEIYIKNIDKPLYFSDSLVRVGICEPNRFEEFYKRHDGGVKVSSNLQKNLGEYYTKRSALLRQIGEKTWQKMYEEEAKKR